MQSKHSQWNTTIPTVYILRLSVAACVSFSSLDLRCLVRASLPLGRLAARLSQHSVLMYTAFMLRFTTSRYRCCGRPVGPFPQASSPYRRSLGMRPSGMRWLWPSQRSLRCLNSVNMLGRPARDRTSEDLWMSLIWIRNKRGPNTDPLGTPQGFSSLGETCSPIFA